jgi:hypothetical protein
MSNPPQFNDPDKMTSTYYVKTSTDAGGVHSNSGVNNKAVSLMVDGGSFNGKTVTALGWDKVLTIYYEAQTNLLTSGSDYLDLYNALNQACTNKLGVNGITSADCAQVNNALLAVEMNKEPSAGFNPSLPQICTAGTNQTSTLYTEDFETGTDGWSFTNPQWTMDNPYGSPYSTSGTGSIYGDDAAIVQSSSSLTQTNGVLVPSGTKTYLQFKHAFGFEYGPLTSTTTGYFDGGVVEYSANNGAWMDASALFNAGQNYNGVVTSYTGSGNPLAGKKAFIKDSHGYVDTRYDLSSLAGKNVKFRWRYGTDYIGYAFGWFVDDVKIVTCLPVGKPTLLSPAKSTAPLKYNYPLLDWTDVSGATEYKLQISKVSTFASFVLNTTVPTSNYQVVTALPVNTLLYWRVAANTPGGTGPWSLVFTFKTGNPPITPLLISPADASAISDDTPYFDWANSKIPTGTTYKSYQLQVSTDPSFATLAVNKTILGTVSSSFYAQPTSLTTGTTYYWRVRTYNTLGQYSKWSSVFSFKLLTGAPVLTAPLANEVLAAAPTSLDWNDVANATGYTVELSTTSDFSNTPIETGTPSASAYTPTTTLPKGVTIYWRVKAESAAGSSGYSSRSFAVKPDAPDLTSPNDAEVLTAAPTSLDWNDVTNATGYTVEISTASDFSSILETGTPTSSDFTPSVSLPTDGTVIYWRVRAESAVGSGAWSGRSFSIVP